MTRLACAWILLLCFAGPVAAAELGIAGLGVSYGTSVYAVDGGQAEFTPNFFYSGQRAYIDGPLAGWRLHRWLAINAAWRLTEVSRDLDTRPPGIEEREGNPELGISLGTVGARLTWLADVGDVHGGGEWQLRLSRTLGQGWRAFTPYLQLDYQDRALAQHLYSISPEESARSGLPAYAEDEVLVWRTGLIHLGPLRGPWLLLTRLDLVRPDSDSPLLRHETGWSFEAGVVYQFAGKS